MSSKTRDSSSCIFVIFGGAGDLTKRLLVPALYNLANEKQLPEAFAVVGIGRGARTDEQYRLTLREQLRDHPLFDEKVANSLTERFRYFQGDMTKAETYPALRSYLDRVGREAGTGGSALFYLAIPPSLFGEIPLLLGKAGLLEQTDEVWRRIVIEKPFGHDLESAKTLNRKLLQAAREEQIYRIDHYLGKETVQNILSIRFGNGIIEPLWNYRYIDSVTITVAETLGVEKRAGYYEGVGALRDMIPNHLFQLVSLIGMEPPNSFAADDLRDEKVKVLEAITPFSDDKARRNAVRGQYGRGQVDGRDVPAYRDEPGVAAGSSTETFAAMRLTIDNWRWSGVPFYLRTGKRLARKLTQVGIRFRSAPTQLFRHTGCHGMPDNLLVFQIQPEELITLHISAKIPGPTICLGEAPLQFDYQKAFGRAPQTGYETLLYDVMRGDATLFQRADQAEAGWCIVDPILRVWNGQKGQGLNDYPSGSWGPEEADHLLARDGKRWPAPDAATSVSPLPQFSLKGEQAA